MKFILVVVAVLASGCLCAQPADELDAGWPIEVLDASIAIDDAVTSIGCWSPAQIVGPFAGRAVGSMAALPGGDVMIVWSHTELNPSKSRLFARRFHPDGSADAPVQLREVEPFMFNESVHTGIDGHGFVLWREEVGGAVAFRQLTAAGTWTGVERLPLLASRKLQQATGAVSADGAVTIATVEYDEALEGAFVQVYENGRPTQLATQRFVRTGLRVVTGADGTLLIAWQSHGPPDYEVKTSVATKRSDGSWHHEFIGSADDSYSGLSVVAHAANASVSWVSQHTLKYAQFADAGWVLDDDVLSLGGSVAPTNTANVHVNGTTAVLFQAGDAHVQLAQFANGTWSGAKTLASLGSFGRSRDVEFASGPTGTSLAGWRTGATLHLAHFNDALTETARTRIDGITGTSDAESPQFVQTDDDTKWVLGRSTRSVDPEFNVVLLRCR